LKESTKTKESNTLAVLDTWRHRIPVWWWLTYDAILGIVIAVSIKPSDPAFWIGFIVLGIAVVVAAVEFAVKLPKSRNRV